MKLRCHISLVLTSFLILIGATASYAQTPQPVQNIDTDIWKIRNNALPGFNYSYDEYLQYVPAGVMMGLKATGYQGRSSWGRMVVSDAFSVAIMAGTVNGLKYSVKRLRPDSSRHNSFPSGHTATSFMTATMLHKEYGWRSPWFSIGGYTVAAVAGVSRILNNQHWMSDVVAGATIGIGSVHLGYFLSDLIFKEKHIYDGYEKPEFLYDTTKKHYVAEMVFGRRFILGSSPDNPIRGGMAGISTDIPFVPGIGVSGRLSASSLTYQTDEVTLLYSVLAGGFYNVPFARILEFQAKIMGGYASLTSMSQHAKASGVSLCAGLGLSMITGNNFKIKAFADLESMSLHRNLPWLNTITIGFSSGWFW
jgi:hypothetical protein